MKNQKTDTKPKQATLSVTFHWPDNTPRKIKQAWEAAFRPRTIAFTIPPTHFTARWTVDEA